MDDTEKPNLSLSTLAEIADQLYEMDRAAWDLLRPMLMRVDIDENLPVWGPRPPKLFARIYLILSNYSAEAFSDEAHRYPRYPPSPNFSKWLLNLAQRIEDHVISVVRDIEISDSEKSLAYHGVTVDGMHAVIKRRLGEQLGQLYQVEYPPSDPPPLPPAIQKQMQITAPSGEQTLSPPTITKTKGTIYAPRAVVKLEAYLLRTQESLTEFAGRAGTSDKTLREFRKTGKVRRYIFDGIAKAMGLTREQLLND
jgi:hypothetical protein